MNPIHEAHGFRFIEAGSGQGKYPVICLHGILGSAEEWAKAAATLRDMGCHVYVPTFPFDGFEFSECDVHGVVDYLRRFTLEFALDPAVFVGNSLGGQVAIAYTLNFPASVAGLVLAGSAGIEEVLLGTSTIRRMDREYLRSSAAQVFHDPVHANDTLVDRIYGVTNDRGHALRILRLARNSQNLMLQDRLSEITAPTAIIWGREDRITPPHVAEQFAQGIADSTLHFLNECGHAPMIEQPIAFGEQVARFLRQLGGDATTESD